MSLTERQAEMLHEHHRTSTPYQYDAWRTGGEPSPLSREPEDRRAVIVGRWMQQDPSDAQSYLSEEMSNEFMQKLASLVISGDKCAIGDLVMSLACGSEMCDGAERFFGGCEE